MTAKTAAAPRRPAPATEQDVAACEAAIGCALPEWLRSRLLIENGWEVDDRQGLTRNEWRFLPVLDRTDRKSRTRTAEDMAWHTQQLHKAAAGVPQGAVVVARAWSPTTRLVLLPDSANSGQLTTMLWRQNGVAEPLPTPVDPMLLGQKPKPGPGSRLRSASELPVFRYHPDPVATGSIRKNHSLVCPCCGLRTGWIYESEPYGLGDQPPNLCPWCIADGSAARKFGSRFAGDIEGTVPDAVAEEVDQRTPGFTAWQTERWLTHCGDAAAFLGRVGWDRLKDLPDATEAVLDDGCDESTLPLITEDGDLSAYLFRCLHCGVHLAYADAS
ncbi:CbrC family protein [Diaphorobacter sp. HDW4B]|uniref:CbrC family protein n=1 Tax=Diaphorobacter sp. HDW4B TaxID=2714925 RepID=UPI00197AD5F3|nr:CbrC family protein [Diaphorobacter sp. HDW4B]